MAFYPTAGGVTVTLAVTLPAATNLGPSAPPARSL